MCIFLCLGDTCLCHIVSCKVLTEGIREEVLLLECDQLVLDRIIILCEAYDMWYPVSLLSQSPVKSSSQKALVISLARSGRKLKNINGILVRNSCNRVCRPSPITVGSNELICLVHHHRTPESVPLQHLFPLSPSPCCQSLICKLHTIPAVITIHCIITSGHHGCRSHQRRVSFIFASSCCNEISLPDAGGVSRPSRKQCT